MVQLSLALTTVWVHGNAVRAQRVGSNPWFPPSMNFTDPVGGLVWTDLVGFPSGWGTTYTAHSNSENWYHISIPTPVFLNGQQYAIKKVYLLYHAGESARLTQIDIYDGALPVQSISVAMFAGDFTHSIVDNINAWVLNERPMTWGLGISAKFTIGGTESDVTFSGAGADFDIATVQPQPHK